MYQIIKTIVAPTTMATPAQDLLLSLPRIIAAYFLCTNFGWSKCPTPEWFISDVAHLGFPLPALFAWAAVLTEVIGGAMLVIGLGTRVAGFFLSITMLVAIFLQKWDNGLWEMLPAMGFLWVAMISLAVGSGRFGLDYWLSQKIQQPNINGYTTALRTIFCIALLTMTGGTLKAQNERPLRGSGKIVVQNYDFKDFDKLQLQDLDGKIKVEIGKKFAIKVEIDDNLLPLLEVNANKEKLFIQIKGNRNNSRYIEDTNIKITICMPEISVLQHDGNTNLEVNGIVGRYFRLEHKGNGNTKLIGSIDEFDLNQKGNGSTDARQLNAKFANVSANGNGNVYVRANARLKAHGNGNGNIYKYGSAVLDASSGVMGNGRVVSKE